MFSPVGFCFLPQATHVQLSYIFIQQTCSQSHISLNIWTSIFIMYKQSTKGYYVLIFVPPSSSTCFNCSDQIIINTNATKRRNDGKRDGNRHENVLFPALWDQCLQLTAKTLTCCWQTFPLHNQGFDKWTGHVVKFLPPPSNEVTTSAWTPAPL